MILAVAFLALLAVSVSAIFVLDRRLRDEAARVNALLTLLEAKAAPAETAAYLAPASTEPAGEYLWSQDGLISVEVTDG